MSARKLSVHYSGCPADMKQEEDAHRQTAEVCMMPQAVGKALARGAEVGYCQLMETVQLLQLMKQVVRVLVVGVQVKPSQLRAGVDQYATRQPSVPAAHTHTWSLLSTVSQPTLTFRVVGVRQ